ncbi:Rid family hydrolase [Microbacterium sp. RD1]|uniref:Rid family hydrolase n=1 Tax=Microbacterium sp. RD1 TaxID=3457313 RepID=UPI003FA56DD3
MALPLYERVLRSGATVTGHVSSTKGRGDLARYHLSEAVRIGDLVEISGQSGVGPDGGFAQRLDEQVRQAFDNVASALECAGASWSDVYSVSTYHVPAPGAEVIESEALDAVAAHLRRHLAQRPPIWTAVAVPVLAHAGMRVEIAVKAAV